MKKIKVFFKWVFWFMISVIIIWIAYGFYLFRGLSPDIYIAENFKEVEYSARETKETLNRDINPAVLFSLMTPETIHFKNNKKFKFLMPQLAASGVLIFKNLYNKEYNICIDKFKYRIPIKSRMASEGYAFGDFTGFEFYIDKIRYLDFIGDVRYSGTEEEYFKNKYPKIFSQNNFPFNFILVKGNSCNENVVGKYKINLDVKDTLNDSKEKYPFVEHFRKIKIILSKNNQ